MPMLTMLRIGLPVWPIHRPRADLVRELGHPVEHLVHRRARRRRRRPGSLAPRRPQRDVQHGAVLGDVDLLAGEHRVDALAQAGLLGQLRAAAAASRR